MVPGINKIQATALTEGNSKVSIKDIKSNDGWTEVTHNILVSTGNYAKVNMILVVDNGKGAIIDLGNDEDEALRIKDYMDKNNISLEYVFITHLHNDHTANFTTLSIPVDKAISPDNAKEGQIVKMGNETFKILKTPGHAGDEHISIELVNEHILAAGDVVVTNMLPLLKYGGSYKSLKPTLERIKKENYDLIIPGHGNIINTSLAIANQLDYITNLHDKIKKMVVAEKKPILDVDDYTYKILDKIYADDCAKDLTVLDKSTIGQTHMDDVGVILGEVLDECGDLWKTKPVAAVSSKVKPLLKVITIKKTNSIKHNNSIYIPIDSIKSIKGKYTAYNNSIIINVNSKKAVCNYKSLISIISNKKVAFKDNCVYKKGNKIYLSLELLTKLGIKVVLK